MSEAVRQASCPQADNVPMTIPRSKKRGKKRRARQRDFIVLIIAVSDCRTAKQYDAKFGYSDASKSICRSHLEMTPVTRRRLRQKTGVTIELTRPKAGPSPHGA